MIDNNFDICGDVFPVYRCIAYQIDYKRGLS